MSTIKDRHSLFASSLSPVFQMCKEHQDIDKQKHRKRIKLFVSKMPREKNVHNRPQKDGALSKAPSVEMVHPLPVRVCRTIIHTRIYTHPSINAPSIPANTIKTQDHISTAWVQHLSPPKKQVRKGKKSKGQRSSSTSTSPSKILLAASNRRRHIRFSYCSFLWTPTSPPSSASLSAQRNCRHTRPRLSRTFSARSASSLPRRGGAERAVVVVDVALSGRAEARRAARRAEGG